MNKMNNTPEWLDHILGWIISVKEQGMGALLAGGMAMLRGKYNGGGWRKTSIDAVMCSVFAWFAKDILNLFGMNTELVYLLSVFVGYLGVDFIGRLLRKATANKIGVSDE
ncbi:phage holin, lambda family [Providencia sp. Je.9.19]|uniref:phage holin, lambda family n=1 Tax=Providencia sp. Je.9.19 TaxID=3142844 RepID=UPI003DA9D356